MAWTQSDVDALKAALARGVTEARLADGRMVRYQSVDDMLKILARAEAEVAASSAAGSPRVVYAEFDHGV